MKAEHKQRMLDLNRHMGMCMLSVLLLITSVFLYFGYRIDKQIEHSTHQRIEEYAVHQRTYISSVLQSRYSLLESFAMYFKDDLLRSKEEFERLSRTLMLAGDFDDILTIDNNGNYYVFVETYNENSYETKIVVLDSEQEALFEIKENDLWGQMVLLSPADPGS